MRLLRDECGASFGSSIASIRARARFAQVKHSWNARANEGRRNSWATMKCMVDDEEISAARVFTDGSVELLASWQGVAACAGWATA